MATPEPPSLNPPNTGDCPPARRTLPNGATYVHANPAGNPELREQLMRRLTDDRWLLSRWFRRRTKNGSYVPEDS